MGMAAELTPERLFGNSGEKLTIGPLEQNFNYLEYVHGHKRIIIGDSAVDVVNRLPTYLARGFIWNIGFYDIECRDQVTLKELLSVYAGRRDIPGWAMIVILHRELEQGDGALIGDGRMNLFWIPEPVVIFEERHDDAWRIERAGTRQFERFDRIFYG